MSTITSIQVNPRAAVQWAKDNGGRSLLDALFPYVRDGTLDYIWENPNVLSDFSLPEVDMIADNKAY